MNAASATSCDVCGVHWNRGAQKEQEELALLRKEVRAAQPTPPTNKGSYAAVAAGKVAVAVNKTPKDAVSLDSEEEEEANTTTLCLPEDYVVNARLLLHPRELNDEWAAEEVLARFLPKQATSNGDTLRAELIDLKSLMSLQLKKMAQGSSEVTSKKITAVEKKIDNCGTEEEGASLDACVLEVGKRNYTSAENLRQARANAGTEKAVQHADRLEEICQEQMAAWEEHLATLGAQRTVREAAWLARGVLLEGRDLEVIELVNSKITAAKQRAGEDEPMPDDDKLKDAQKELKHFKEQAAAEADKAAKAAQQEKDSLLSRLEALEKMMKQASAPPPVAEEARLTKEAMEQCQRTIMYTASELPALKSTPEKSYKLKLVLIATNLAAWGRAGRIPITYRQLLSGSAGTPDELQEAFAILQEVAGEPIWKRLYAGADITTDVLVPFQLGSILQESLSLAETAMKSYANIVCYTVQAAAQFKDIYDEDVEERKAKRGKYTPY